MRGIVVQWLNYVQFFVTPWTTARQASLSFTISQSLLKLMFIESVMLSNHLILCCPLLLLPSIFPSIRVFSNESVLQIRWLKYWSFSFSPSKEHIACLFIYHIPPMHSLANNRYSINVGLMNYYFCLLYGNFFLSGIWLLPCPNSLYLSHYRPINWETNCWGKEYNFSWLADWPRRWQTSVSKKNYLLESGCQFLL